MTSIYKKKWWPFNRRKRVSSKRPNCNDRFHPQGQCHPPQPQHHRHGWGPNHYSQPSYDNYGLKPPRPFDTKREFELILEKVRLQEEIARLKAWNYGYNKKHINRPNYHYKGESNESEEDELDRQIRLAKLQKKAAGAVMLSQLMGQLGGGRGGPGLIDAGLQALPAIITAVNPLAGAVLGVFTTTRPPPPSNSNSNQQGPGSSTVNDQPDGNSTQVKPKPPEMPENIPLGNSTKEVNNDEDDYDEVGEIPVQTDLLLGKLTPVVVTPKAPSKKFSQRYDKDVENSDAEKKYKVETESGSEEDEDVFSHESGE